MGTLTTPRSPTCNQLRLAAFNYRKTQSVFHVRLVCLQKPRQRQIRCFYGSRGYGNRINVVEQRPGSDVSIDAFSGWSGDNNGSEETTESKPKKGLDKGLVGAGVAGIVLFAGLTFAALSISKRASGPRQKMETLTTYQEESLTSSDQNDTLEEEPTKREDAVPDDSKVGSETGIDKDSSFYIKDKDITTENELGHDINLEYTSSGEVMNNVSDQQDLREEIPADEVQANPKLPEFDVSDGSVDASSIETSDGGPVTEKLESSNDLNDDFIDSKIAVSSVSEDGLENLNTDDQEVEPATNGSDESELPLDSSLNSVVDKSSEHVAPEISVIYHIGAAVEPQLDHKEDVETISPRKEDSDLQKLQFRSEENNSYLDNDNLSDGSSIPIPESGLPYTPVNQPKDNEYFDNIRSTPIFDSMDLGKLSSSASIPAPSVVSPALQALPGKVLVPAIVDQVQGQALAALQLLKVIESDVQPGDLCTRREYARWLVSASSALSRNTMSKVYPAMFIENITELAFDDITPEDPDFSSIQGLAEAGLIASKISRRDMDVSDQDESPLCFYPESPLSRQDLVSWKMSLEKRLLPLADRTILQQLSGFIDIDKINPDAWPALIADLSAGEQGIVGLAFGCTRLFQPDKPVTKGQAAIALATGEASDIVGEELARIEAESAAEKAVAAHSALVDEVEKDVNATFEKDLLLEREKINTVEKMAEEAKQELERLRAEREEENIKLMKERAAVDSEMEVLSRLRHEVEEQLQSVMSNKVEISYEKERLSKLRADAEMENQEIARLQYELEVERKALSMARAWAEDEAKRAREQAKVLEEARDRWESQGIKVVVDNDLREEANAGVTWLSAGKQFSIEGTKSRAQNLVDRLKAMTAEVSGKSKETINRLIQKILFLISQIKEWGSKAGSQVGEFKDVAVSKVSSSIQGLQQSSVGLSSTVKQGAKRVAGDCREGVEKFFAQRFKT